MVQGNEDKMSSTEWDHRAVQEYWQVDHLNITFLLSPGWVCQI